VDKEIQSNNSDLDELINLIKNEDYDLLKNKLINTHPAEIAELIEATPQNSRLELWQKIDLSIKGLILKELNENIQKQIIGNLETDEIISITENFAIDDLADIIPSLPEKALHKLLLSMDEQNKTHLQKVLTYDDNTAGGLMNTDIIVIRANVTVDTVFRYFRLLKKIPRDTDQIFVVDRNNRFINSIYITTLLSEQPEQKISNLIKKEVQKINANMSSHEVAKLFTQRDLISAPVVDENQILIGRITVDDIVDVIRDEAETSVKAIGGVNNEDIFDSIKSSFRKRSLWLGINLITAFITVIFIGLFSATLEQQIALAILMPIVASMGGVAGSQTLTLVIRGIALDKVSNTHFSWLLNKEIMMSLLNGILWASIIASITYIWFADTKLSLIIAIATIFNLITASFFGVVLPVLMSKLKIDPALAGNVVLTTITDIVGFVIFLGLASLFL